jgi:hypothetical protein
MTDNLHIALRKNLYAQRLFGKNYWDLDVFAQDAIDDHMATEWRNEGLQK